MIPLSWLVCHLVADFYLQTSWMANNKSKDWRALCTHTAVYSLCWFWLGLPFVILTFLSHTLTDAITSRMTGWAWQQKRVRLFFCIIGTDQVIHYTTLYLTGRYLGVL